MKARRARRHGRRGCPVRDRARRRRVEGTLATGGVHAKVRHPQYTGLFLIVFGEGSCTGRRSVFLREPGGSWRGVLMSASTVIVAINAQLLKRVDL